VVRAAVLDTLSAGADPWATVEYLLPIDRFAAGEKALLIVAEARAQLQESARAAAQERSKLEELGGGGAAAAGSAGRKDKDKRKMSGKEKDNGKSKGKGKGKGKDNMIEDDASEEASNHFDDADAREAARDVGPLEPAVVIAACKLALGSGLLRLASVLAERLKSSARLDAIERV